MTSASIKVRPAKGITVLVILSDEDRQFIPAMVPEVKIILDKWEIPHLMHGDITLSGKVSFVGLMGKPGITTYERIWAKRAQGGKTGDLIANLNNSSDGWMHFAFVGLNRLIERTVRSVLTPENIEHLRTEIVNNARKKVAQIAGREAEYRARFRSLQQSTSTPLEVRSADSTITAEISVAEGDLQMNLLGVSINLGDEHTLMKLRDMVEYAVLSQEN